MKLKNVIILLFVFISIVCITGCTSSRGATAVTPTPQVVYVTVFVTQTPAENAAPAYVAKPITTKIPVVTTAAPSPSAQSQTTTFQGSGDDVQSFTSLGSGLGIFAITHSGDSNFAIWLEDSNGKKLELLVNEIGAYNGKKSVSLKPEAYYLDVTANGPWSIKLTGNAAPGATAQSKTTTLQGTGDDVQSFTSSGIGLGVFTMKHTGESNFAVWLEDSNGKKLELLVNEIGTYNGKKSYNLKSGIYYLDVTADGPWSIVLTSP